MTTTLGAVLVFSFAYRFSSAGGCRVTVTPARDSVFPLHCRVRSSVTCLEWSWKVEWLDARLRSLLPGSIWLLDMWHAVESFGEYTAELFGKGSKPAWSLYRDLVKLLTGKRPT